MIQVDIHYDKNGLKEIKSSGHAMYDDYGKDIVCAGVSTVLIGGINAIYEIGLIDSITYEVEEGMTSIQVKESSHDLQTILRVMEIQLRSIEESYSDYITIMEV